MPHSLENIGPYTIQSSPRPAACWSMLHPVVFAGRVVISATTSCRIVQSYFRAFQPRSYRTDWSLVFFSVMFQVLYWQCQYETGPLVNFSLDAVVVFWEEITASDSDEHLSSSNTNNGLLMTYQVLDSSKNGSFLLMYYVLFYEKIISSTWRVLKSWASTDARDSIP